MHTLTRTLTTALALTALVMPQGKAPTQVGAAVITLGVFGTALLYGDGLITPAISVLSAVEGFEVATSAFSAWVIPVSVAILVALFAITLYIRTRFHEYRYAMGAVLALVHDVLVTTGAIAVFASLGLVDAEIDLNMIAALLTIIGYSLNDTIVI